MKPLYLFRPEPGWSVSAQTARAMGIDVHGAPLFTIEPVEWTAPSPDDFDGILVGSANAFRHGGKHLEKLTRMPRPHCLDYGQWQSTRRIAGNLLPASP